MTNEIDFTDDRIEFIGYGESSNVSKQEVEGRRLWDLCFERKDSFGGWFVNLFGQMGSGKTSLMLQAARRIIKEHPDEVLFWREPPGNALQASNLGKNFEFQLLCEQRYPMKLWVLQQHGMNPSDDIPIRCFSGNSDLLKIAKPGCLNVVYYKENWRWIQLLDRLKRWRSWQTVFIDEIEDVVPGRPEGKAWHMNELFAASIKSIRKGRVSLWGNTQNAMDLDPRCRHKSMMNIYLYGAQYDRDSPLYRGAVQSLDVGQCWIVFGSSQFGLLSFRPVLPRAVTYMVLPTGDKAGKW